MLQLAQFNLAKLRHGLDDPGLTRFEIGANMIRRAAGEADGHVWNQQDVIDDVYFATRSVWQSVAALEDFVYGGIHLRYMKLSATWFTPAEERGMVLWQVEAGTRPSLEEARSRLQKVGADGPGAEAFDFATSRQFVAAADAT